MNETFKYGLFFLGGVALGAIGTGIYFGVEAGNYDDKVSDAIKANKDKNNAYGNMKTQRATKKDYDKASDYAILFLVRSDKDEDIFANELYISPTVDSEGGGVVAGFTF